MLPLLNHEVPVCQLLRTHIILTAAQLTSSRLGPSSLHLTTPRAPTTTASSFRPTFVPPQYSSAAHHAVNACRYNDGRHSHCTSPDCSSVPPSLFTVLGCIFAAATDWETTTALIVDPTTKQTMNACMPRSVGGGWSSSGSNSCTTPSLRKEGLVTPPLSWGHRVSWCPSHMDAYLSQGCVQRHPTYRQGFTCCLLGCCTLLEAGRTHKDRRGQQAMQRVPEMDSYIMCMNPVWQALLDCI